MFEVSEIHQIHRNNVDLKYSMSCQFLQFLFKFDILRSVETQIRHKLFEFLFFVFECFMYSLNLLLYVYFAQLKLVKDDLKYLLVVLIVLFSFVLHQKHVVYLILLHLFLQQSVVFLELLTLLALFRLHVTAIQILISNTRIIQKSLFSVAFLCVSLTGEGIGKIDFYVVSLGFHIILSLIYIYIYTTSTHSILTSFPLIIR